MPIEKRNGLWYMRFQVGGRIIRRSTGLPANKKNERAAKNFEAAEKKRLLETAETHPKQVDEAVSDFLDYAQAKLRSRTYRDYRKRCCVLTRFLRGRTVASISEADIISMRDSMLGLHVVSRVSVRCVLLTFRAFFHFAAKNGWCETNPVHARILPPARSISHIMSIEEERRYNRAAEPHWGFPTFHIIRLARLHGVPVDITVALRKTDVNLHQGTLAVRHRNGLQYDVRLTAEAKQILAQHMREGSSQWLFPRKSDSSKHLAYADVLVRHRATLRKAEMSVFPLNVFRYTCAVRMIEAGVDVRVVSAQLGLSFKVLAKLIKELPPDAVFTDSALQRYESAIEPLARDGRTA